MSNNQNGNDLLNVPFTFDPKELDSESLLRKGEQMNNDQEDNEAREPNSAFYHKYRRSFEDLKEILLVLHRVGTLPGADCHFKSSLPSLEEVREQIRQVNKKLKKETGKRLPTCLCQQYEIVFYVREDALTEPRECQCSFCLEMFESKGIVACVQDKWNGEVEAQICPECLASGRGEALKRLDWFGDGCYWERPDRGLVLSRINIWPEMDTYKKALNAVGEASDHRQDLPEGIDDFEIRYTEEYNRYLSPNEICEKYSVSRSSLWEWEQEGYITAERIPGGYKRFHEGDFRRALRIRTRPKLPGFPR